MRTLTTGWKFLEGIRWREGRFWASDTNAGKVIAVSPEGEVEEIVSARAVLSGLGWLPSGELLAVSVLDRHLLKFDGTALQPFADMSSVAIGNTNDMITDSKGRSFVGSMGFDLRGGEPVAPGVIVRVDPDGSVDLAADDLLFPNGMTLLDGERTLVVAESFGQRLTAFSVAPDGRLTDRREWARFGPAAENGEDAAAYFASTTLVPDGIAADSVGNIWVADPIAGKRVVLVAPGGDILAELRTGKGDGIYTCVLGGKDGAVLGVCAAPPFDQAMDKDAPGRSSIVAFDLDSAGLPV